MTTTQHHTLNERTLADAWADLQAHADAGLALHADAYRLAFSDPEFLLRRETRGIRFQLEMLKPDLDQTQAGVENTVVVFGSARFPSPESAQKSLEEAQQGNDAKALAVAQRKVRNAAYYDQARLFARLVAAYSNARPAAERLFIATGGGPGIMEAANRGAHEMGAPNVGLNIALPHEQSHNPYITPELCFKFHYFALRKMHFLLHARGPVSFPGGYGTLDELFEVLTLIQTGKMTRIPVVLVGRAFWRRLVDFDFLVDEGYVSPEDIELLTYADDAQEIIETLERFHGGPAPDVVTP